MIVEVDFNRFKLLIGETNNIFVEEKDDRWCIAMPNGVVIVYCEQLKFPSDEQNILFIEQNFERPNLHKVNKIHLNKMVIY